MRSRILSACAWVMTLRWTSCASRGFRLTTSLSPNCSLFIPRSLASLATVMPCCRSARNAAGGMRRTSASDSKTANRTASRTPASALAVAAVSELGAGAGVVDASARPVVRPNVIRAAVAPPLTNLTAIAAIGFMSFTSLLDSTPGGAGNLKLRRRCQTPVVARSVFCKARGHVLPARRGGGGPCPPEGA